VPIGAGTVTADPPVLTALTVAVAVAVPACVLEAGVDMLAAVLLTTPAPAAPASVDEGALVDASCEPGAG